MCKPLFIITVLLSSSPFKNFIPRPAFSLLPQGIIEPLQILFQGHGVFMKYKHLMQKYGTMTFRNYYSNSTSVGIHMIHLIIKCCFTTSLEILHIYHSICISSIPLFCMIKNISFIYYYFIFILLIYIIYNHQILYLFILNKAPITTPVITHRILLCSSKLFAISPTLALSVNMIISNYYLRIFSCKQKSIIHF